MTAIDERAPNDTPEVALRDFTEALLAGKKPDLATLIALGNGRAEAAWRVLEARGVVRLAVATHREHALRAAYDLVYHKLTQELPTHLTSGLHRLIADWSCRSRELGRVCDDFEAWGNRLGSCRPHDEETPLRMARRLLACITGPPGECADQIYIVISWVTPIHTAGLITAAAHRSCYELSEAMSKREQTALNELRWVADQVAARILRKAFGMPLFTLNGVA